MTSDFDRDKSVDELLRGARRASSVPEAGPACLDAEMLAAWADGGLDVQQAQVVEAHVADCARCRAMSAALFATSDSATDANEEVVATKVIPFRRRSLMYWIPIAAGTAAATLAIWFGTRDRTQSDYAMEMSKSVLPAAADSAKAEPVDRFAGRQGQTGAVPAPPRAASRKRAESKTEQRLDAIEELQIRKPAANAVRPAPAPVAAPVGTVALPPPPPVAAPPVPVTGAAATPTPTPVAVSAAAQVQQTARLSRELIVKQSGEPATVMAEFVTTDPETFKLTTQSTVGGAAGAGGRGGAGRGGGGAGGGAARVVADAGASPPTYWRILSTDVVERSADRLTWQPVVIDPPVRGLTSGASPSPTVCWIVGKNGLVLLTTDGRTFSRVIVPTSTDLASVSSLSALQAAIVTADGKTLATTDGGKTWK